MKLKKEEVRLFRQEHGLKSDKALAKALDVGDKALDEILRGVPIGYETTKTIYNRYGQAAAEKLIDFEGNTIRQLTGRYTLVGNQLV